MESALLWAKSSENGGHPLQQHLLDVGAVALELLDRLPDSLLCHLGRIGTEDLAAFRREAAGLAALHDIGKASPGFQAKWPAGRDAIAVTGLKFPAGSPDRHDATSVMLITGWLQRGGASAQDADALANAAGAHHGHAIPRTLLRQVKDFGLSAPWTAVAGRILDQTVVALQAEGRWRLPPTDESRAALLKFLAGLCAAADWIGSSETFFPYRRAWTNPQAHLLSARKLAATALDRIGWTVFDPIPDLDARAALSVALPGGATPRPLQEVLAQLVDAQELPHRPCLIVIEAPPGEGKTEAAMAADALLRSKAQARGLYVAMPTQATSNALYGRAAGYLGRLHGPGIRATLQLAHGAASLEQTELLLREVGAGPLDGTVAASAWFIGAKRALLAPDAVGTVDQALVGVLNARHHFVRLFGLAGKTVVVDEVHAYDAYTGGLVERLVAWLRALSCNVVIMSATLPNERRESLCRAFGGEALAPVEPYPRITFVSDNRTIARSVAASRGSLVQVARLRSNPTALAQQAGELASRGAAVLVIANTVARAQAIYQDLRSTGLALLFHARFPMDQRLDIESRVVGTFGPNGAAGRAGRIVVATQVAEQSLDVDFDVLITDIAPGDLLLQRIGRMHRHLRQRPSCASTAVVHVAGLAENGSAEPTAYRPVYEALPVLRTAAWLHLRGRLDLPDDIDPLVQHVYGPGAKLSETAWADEECEAQLRWTQLQDRLEAFARQAAIPLPEHADTVDLAPPTDDDDAMEGRVRFGTRMGELSCSVIPIYRLGADWSTGRIGGRRWAADGLVPAVAARELGLRHLRVGNPVIVKALLAEPQPAGWATHASLAGYRCLPLDENGVFDAGPVRARLDDELGLVYETARTQRAAT